MKNEIIKTGEYIRDGERGSGYFYIIENMKQLQIILDTMNKIGTYLATREHIESCIMQNYRYFRFVRFPNGNFIFYCSDDIEIYLRAGLKKVYAKDLEISEVL